MDKQIMLYLHMEYYPTIKRNELSIQAKKWINFRIIMLRKRAYNKQNILHVCFNSYKILQNANWYLGIENIPVATTETKRGGRKGVSEEYEENPRVDILTVLIVVWVQGCIYIIYLNQKILIFKNGSLLYINYILIKLF